ncbi:MAG: hypothetical protein U0V73_11895 [Acidimicrobiia bacterium]
MRRIPLTAVVVSLLVLACSGGAKPATSRTTTTPTRSAGGGSPFRGLGTWVGAYDYAAAYQDPGQQPPVRPDSVDDMARLGVRTLYLQASKDDPRSPDPFVDRALVGRFLVRAHAHHLRVVAWYLPKLADLGVDERRLQALRDFSVGGERFDGFALDIEWTQDVPDLATRNRRVVELSRRLHASAGGRPLAAIVLPPVQLEVVNPLLWPSFPWRALRASFDVWMPMAYWTLRSKESGYRDAFRYVDENVRRLRANLGSPHAVVHVVGGIADRATRVDYEGFRNAMSSTKAIGFSVYDYNTTPSSAWPFLREVEDG